MVQVLGKSRLCKKPWTCFEGPFGEVIRATGPMAKANPFRFSTKYQDDESDLLYYGYRYYSGSLGRWISRDVVGETGELHLYSFCHDDPVQSWDLLGLFPTSQTLIGSGIYFTWKATDLGQRPPAAKEGGLTTATHYD
jgi:RHS repeat-associated protein